jgi:hypothetical protein
MKFCLEESIDILSRTPGVLSALLGGLPDAWLHRSEGEGTFSPHDVLGHLIYGEQTDWIPRARIILDSGESRPFEPFNRWGHKDLVAARSTGDLLQEFATLRSANIGALRELRLDEEALDAIGMHPELGRVTMRELLASWVVHDLSHIAQIVRVMAKQHRTDVGPWREHMSILR